MTISAIRTEPSLVRLIFFMARITILESTLEIAKCTGSKMALVAGERGMFAAELEGKGTVVKMLAQTIHAIVTAKACRTIGQCVGPHEYCIDLAMTAFTRVQIKNRNILAMAITTVEWLARRRKLVSLQ
jgi:hypothetical protein